MTELDLRERAVELVGLTEPPSGLDAARAIREGRRLRARRHRAVAGAVLLPMLVGLALVPRLDSGSPGDPASAAVTAAASGTSTGAEGQLTLQRLRDVLGSKVGGPFVESGPSQSSQARITGVATDPAGPGAVSLYVGWVDVWGGQAPGCYATSGLCWVSHDQGLTLIHRTGVRNQHDRQQLSTSVTVLGPQDRFATVTAYNTVMPTSPVTEAQTPQTGQPSDTVSVGASRRATTVLDEPTVEALARAAQQIVASSDPIPPVASTGR